jgi:hypothetical protein
MARNYFALEKELNTLLYVVQQMGQPDYHKAFKTLYFAEQDYLVNFGMSLMGDDYFVKMPNGPVPSNMYDFVKFVNGKHNGQSYQPDFVAHVKDCLELVPPYYIRSKARPNLDYLSEAEQETIATSVEKCRNLDYFMLRTSSHDSAWEKTENKKRIDPVDIASAGGATPEELDYLRDSLNDNLFAAV